MPTASRYDDKLAWLARRDNSAKSRLRHDRRTAIGKHFIDDAKLKRFLSG
jgi:hypothetical protein